MRSDEALRRTTRPPRGVARGERLPGEVETAGPGGELGEYFQSRDEGDGPDGDVSRREVALAEGDRLRELPPDRYPNVTALADQLTQPDMEARFTFGLERIIDGLEALLP